MGILGPLIYNCLPFILASAAGRTSGLGKQRLDIKIIILELFLDTVLGIEMSPILRFDLFRRQRQEPGVIGR